MIISGNWQQLTLDSPLHLLAGDSPNVVGNMLQVWRAGVLTETRTLTLGLIVSPNPVASDRTITELFYFKETRMPGINVVQTNVRKNSTTGTIMISTSDGENSEYASWDDVKADVAGIDTDGEIARKLLLAKLVSLSPDGTNLEAMIGGSCAINMAADVPVVITYPE